MRAIQKVLLKDDMPETIEFYKSCSWMKAEEAGCISFIQSCR